MSISLIAAVSKNNCIGKQGGLPWNIPEDLKHFKQHTVGKIVLMGRKTWESIPEKFRPLPERLNIVISRQSDLAVPSGVETSLSIDDALRGHASDHIMVIGGAEIYRQTIDVADTLYLTEVDQTVEDGDAFFPEINRSVWKEVDRELHQGYAFVTYKRI